MKSELTAFRATLLISRGAAAGCVAPIELEGTSAAASRHDSGKQDGPSSGQADDAPAETGEAMTCGAPVGGADAGRPFLVDGRIRCADAVPGAAWCGTMDGLSGGTETSAVREAVAAHYVCAGLMEHASVASFSRFVLQLLAVGAPPQMVLEAQAAIGDEVRHAQTCFAIARHFGAGAVGPGPLAIDGALAGPNDLVAVVTAVIREGCVGETLAAVEVEEAAAWTADPSLADALRRIAADEARHATLAWRFVAWALERTTSPQRAAIAGALAEAVQDAYAEAEPARAEVDDARLRAYGVMSAEDRLGARRQTLRDVVTPCAEALLGPGSTPTIVHA